MRNTFNFSPRNSVKMVGCSLLYKEKCQRNIVRVEKKLYMNLFHIFIKCQTWEP